MSDRPSGAGEELVERTPWSRPSVLLSGAFLLALVLLGIVVAAIGGSGEPPPRAANTGAGAQPAATPSRSTATRSGGSGCSLPAGSQAVPSAGPPAGAQWGQVGSMSVPQATSTLGPERIDGVWDTCFARNPRGALLAAMNLWAEGTAVDPNVLFHRLAVGAPADVGNNVRLDSSGPVQFAGYRYLTYAPSQAQLQIVIRGPQGKLVAFATTMRFTGGDWKYVFPAAGQVSLQTIPDLTGYVPWSAF